MKSRSAQIHSSVLHFVSDEIKISSDPLQCIMFCVRLNQVKLRATPVHYDFCHMKSSSVQIHSSVLCCVSDEIKFSSDPLQCIMFCVRWMPRSANIHFNVLCVHQMDMKLSSVTQPSVVMLCVRWIPSWNWVPSVPLRKQWDCCWKRGPISQVKARLTMITMCSRCLVWMSFCMDPTLSSSSRLVPHFTDLLWLLTVIRKCESV